ncbi:MAG: PBP1A family penicillin-binding protein [Gemmatimonadota bacterium]
MKARRTAGRFAVKIAHGSRGFWQRMRAWAARHPVLVKRASITVLLVASMGVGVAVGTWQAICRDCPSIAQIYVWEPIRATKMFAHDGRLVTEFALERRTPVDIASLPPYVPKAFVAIEDKRFYKHGGFDVQGILRAARNLLLRVFLRMDVYGGGSTITQQLARHMFTQEIGFERRPERKLKEIKVSIELEDVYNKDQILAAYINQVHYGHGWYGIETAAQHYFGKPAVEINPGEAALLAAVINAPSRYDPFNKPSRALQRRNVVLALMAQQGYLTRAEADQWKTTPLPDAPKVTDTARLAPYFVEWVRIQMDNQWGTDLYRSGLRVHTTLDVDLQRAAQMVMDSGWARIEKVPGYRHPKYAESVSRQSRRDNQTPYLQGMFIAMEPQTGDVRALVGGRDFKDSKFNRATQALRQPGSVFKPFVMTAAIAGGIPISHIVVDSPFSMPQVDGTIWAPENFDPDYRGPINLRETLRYSVNVPTIKLGLEVGLESVVQYARRMGIRTPIPAFPAISIGSADVIPMQIAEAYSVFATSGYRPIARAVTRVEDADGRVLWERRPQIEQVLDSTTAALVRDLMRTVVDRGTGYSARDPAQGNLPYEIPAAGKTGTTNDYTNIWFVGYTPNLVAAVWFGFDRPQRILGNASGGVYVAPVWGRFMRMAYYGEGPKVSRPADWVWPSGITTRRIDRTTGKLATEFCPLDLVYDEFFAAGTEPTDSCDLHTPLLGTPARDTVRR